MRLLLAVLTALALAAPTQGLAQGSIRPSGGAAIYSGTAFPSSPTLGTLFTILDDSAAGACDSAAGTAQTLCRWNGSAWLPLGDGQAAGGTVAVADIDTSAELRGILTDETGTGALYFQNGALGTPTSGTLTNATGLPVGTGIAGLGTGVATALAVNVGSAGAPVVLGGAGGTPSSITLTNAGGTAASLTAGAATALAADPTDCAANNFAITIAASGNLTCAQPSISAGVSGLAANVATFLGTPSSANLAAALTNETGSGAIAFGTAPTLDSPVITTKFNAPSVTAFPGAPSTNDIVIVTDDSVAGACDSAAGSARSWCQWNGSAWVSIGDGTAGGGGTAVTAASTFATDNLLIRSDGTSRGVQNSGISINDTDDVSGVNDMAVGGNVTVTGTVTASNLVVSGTLTDEMLCDFEATGNVIQCTTDPASFQPADADLTTWAGITPGTNVGTFIATPSSANLAAAVTGETGSGALVFGTSPALTTPNLGTPSAVVLTAGTGLPVSTGLAGAGTGVATALAQNVTGTGGIALATAPTVDSPVFTTKLRIPRVTAFPGSPGAGDVVIVTDDSTAGACDSAAGSITSFCQWDGAAWVKLGDGTSAGGALSSGDIDTSAEIRAIVGDESGTGALLFAGGDIGAAVATTPAANDNDTSVATTAYVQTELTAYASDTATFTGKTLDAEGTGNVITLPLYKDFPMAGCNNATATSFWDLPTASPAVPACRTGTNTQKGTLDFADAVSLTAQSFFRLPPGWTGAIDATVTWISTTTTGDVVWQLAIACASDGEADDPAFTDDVFTADTTKGTANLLNDTASNTITTTGTCAAGDIAHIRIKRDAAHASDNMAGTARLVNLQLTYRVAH